MSGNSAAAVAALAALAFGGTSSAASVSGWTETKADHAARLVRYVDEHEVAVAQDNLAYAKNGCPQPTTSPVPPFEKTGPDTKTCAGAKQALEIAAFTRDLQAAQRGYAPSDVSCRS